MDYFKREMNGSRMGEHVLTVLFITDIPLDYDVPKWFYSNSYSIKEFKTQANYQMRINEKNKVLKNEILNLFGKKDKIFAIGKYLHQMSPGPDDIMKSSVKVDI